MRTASLGTALAHWGEAPAESFFDRQVSILVPVLKSKLNQCKSKVHTHGEQIALCAFWNETNLSNTFKCVWAKVDFYTPRLNISKDYFTISSWFFSREKLFSLRENYSYRKGMFF